MKTIHNTKNCNYRRFLFKLVKQGRISGQFYRFLCKNFPFRLAINPIQILVNEVSHGKTNESKAINILVTKHKDKMQYQQEMYKSNVECRNKTGLKQINK